MDPGMVPAHLPDPIRAIRLTGRKGGGERGSTEVHYSLNHMGKATVTFVSQRQVHVACTAVSHVISEQFICY